MLWSLSYAKFAVAPRDLPGWKLRRMIDAEVRLAAFKEKTRASDFCKASSLAGGPSH